MIKISKNILNFIKSKMKRVLRYLCMFIFFVIVSCSVKREVVVNNKNEQPKNVILLISDGAGLSQISSAFFNNDLTPNYSRFKNIGLIKTSSHLHDITDSAAAATSFATGEKTYNGAIGVASDSTNLTSIVEILNLKNVKSGIVATSSITHATPASFYAHVVHRNMQEDIALDLVESNVDFFAGGGLKYFNNRSDKLNLLESVGFKKHHIDTIHLDDYSAIKNYEKIGYLLAPNELPKFSQNRGDFLPNATELAIKFLSKNDTPFFLMCEGSQIDWGGHQNDGAYVISEVLDFDNTIGRVLDFAEKDGNTLVIVTSDHETGGFTLSAQTRKRDDGSEYKDVDFTFSNGGHSATLIPVFAYGPGSDRFIGIYENTEIFQKIVELTRWEKK